MFFLFSPVIFQPGKALEMRIEHRLQHSAERQYLWNKRKECQENPDKAAIAEIDGMDQSKTNSPRNEENPKSLDRHEVLKNHIVGVLINGTDFSVISHRDHWKRDPNLSVSILVQTLERLPKPWPKKLYIQLDNCISENKNATVFFIVALLVHRGVFDEVNNICCQRVSQCKIQGYFFAG